MDHLGPAGGKSLERFPLTTNTLMQQKSHQQLSARAGRVRSWKLHVETGAGGGADRDSSIRGRVLC